MSKPRFPPPCPKDEAGLRALPVTTPELERECFLLRDTSDDAVFAFTDESGSWAPVYGKGQWWKRRIVV